MRSFSKYILTEALLLLLSPAFAQVQKGYVRTVGRPDNREGERISGITIRVAGLHNPFVSGKDGTFDFDLGGDKTEYTFTSILDNRFQYELQEKELLGRKEPVSTTVAKEIVMISLKEKQAIENKKREQIERQYQHDLKRLEAQREQNEITIEKYRKDLRALQEAFDKRDMLITDLAEHFASIDYAKLSEEQARIKALLEDSDPLTADSLINAKGDLVERVKDHLAFSAENTAQQEALNKKLASEQASKTDLMQDCESKFLIFAQQFQNDSAAYYLELLVSLDTMNVENLNCTGLFIREYLAQYDKAQEYFNRTLRIAQKLYGEEHPDVARSYNNIGGIYYSQGEYARGLEYFVKALDIQKKIYGEEHPDVATSYNNIGGIYDSQGEYARGLEYFVKALEIRKKIYGEEHPDVARSYNNIGGIYSSQGEYARGLEYNVKALEIRKKLYGEEHPDVARSYNNIGLIYYSQGECARGLEYFVKALEIRKKIYGEEHPDVARSYNNIGGIYSSQGEYARGLEYYVKALDIQKKIYGEEHPDVATSYNNIGYIYSSQGEYARGLEYYVKALEIRKKIYGEEHPDVATSYNNIGHIYSSQGEYARGLEYNVKALEILKKIYGEEHPDVATSYNNIGYIYYSQGEYARGLEYYVKALEIRKKIYGEEHPDVATSYINIGLIYYSQGEYARGLEYYVKAMDIVKKIYGEEHPYVAETFMLVHSISEMTESNTEFEQLINETLPTMAYTLTCIDGDTPANQQGMSGEYIVLKFEDWTIQDNMSLINKNNEFRGKPKTIVVMKDGAISEHFFENTIDVQISCKFVGKEEKQRIMDAYQQWKMIRNAEK